MATAVFAVATALGFHHFGENFPLVVPLGGVLVGLVGLAAAAVLWIPGASAYFSRTSTR